MRSTGFFCLAVLALTIPPAAAQEPQTALFTHGQVTFTQDGHEVTWLLWQGSVKPLAELVPTTSVGLLFTPDGKPGPEDGESLFRLSFKKSRETYSLIGVAVENGPGGPGVSTHRESKSKCKLNVTRFDEKGLAGTVSCLGPFDGGPPVTKALFSATP
jgi:hypothetical protein